MMYSSIRLVAFDCDGVMFDTRQANSDYYNTILNHFGLPPMTEAQFAFVHMHTVDRSLAFLFEQRPDLLDAVNAFRGQMGYAPFIRAMIIEPHLKDLLVWLKPRCKTAVATNRADSMNRVLAFHQLQGAFDAVVCARDVARPKPHPDLLLAAMDRLGALPSQTVYIGDSPLDMLAAKAAAIRFIAYQNQELEADAHIRSLKEVQALLTTVIPAQGAGGSAKRDDPGASTSCCKS
jgi:beta-phosphoglucomutase-like phosphatase (HAD superfamily)